jgi:hypothetical protein
LRILPLCWSNLPYAGFLFHSAAQAKTGKKMEACRSDVASLSFAGSLARRIGKGRAKGFLVLSMVS